MIDPGEEEILLSGQQVSQAIGEYLHTRNLVQRKAPFHIALRVLDPDKLTICAVVRKAEEGKESV